ncbi:MAG TPA: glycine--tRNA ligase [Candidatus Thermoplasmatota archaeon]|jgi:glycyl-tRNA synthetase|nr:glycine--tRNA ligase [Candidatus Thermoplasmatota archaeon]
MPPEAGPDVHEDLMAMLKRRGFVQPAYEIYGGLAGFYDYGPLGAALKRNIEDAWRRVYVLGEGFAEIQSPTISPEPVFRASGHLASFQDPLVECQQCGANLRADKLLEEVRDSLAGKPWKLGRIELQDKDKEGRPRTLVVDGADALGELNIGTLQLDALDQLLAKLAPKCPECGQFAWGKAHYFNLMFKAPVGPGARAKDAYLRPETAQGMFTTFPWLYRFFREKLPFGAVQVGKAYRNEIAPRQALLRLREFHQMEAEVFVHPQQKGHARFVSVARDELPLVPAQGRTREEVKAGQIVAMPVGDAVKKGIVGSEALAYYLWLTHAYLVGIGIPSERLRFRQHAREEMAHYSSDTWDCEVRSPRFGWVEIVGIADRGSYDLDAHSKVSGERLAHFERYETPREVEHERVVGDKAKLGKLFKADAAAVLGALGALSPEQARGTHDLQVQVGERTLTVPRDAVKVERVREKVAGDYVVPHVIEPSYGVDRIFYALLEASYRPATKEREWSSLALLPSMAPIQVGVFPLMAKDNLDTTARNTEEDLRRSGLVASYDDGGSIGKRYARMDEVGTPFCVTIDYDTLQDGTVTLRERDSGRQKRLPRRALIEVLQDLLKGQRRFETLDAPDVAAPA